MGATTVTGPGPRPCPLWAHAADEQATAAKDAEFKADAFVYFVGARGSGKTTLRDRVFFPSKAAEAPAPSGCVDYAFSRREGTASGERTLAHLWELGGHEGPAAALARGGSVFLTFKEVTSAVVVVVLDLSEPASVLPTAEAWLAAVRGKLAGTYAAFERKGLSLPDQLRQRARQRLAGAAEGRDEVGISGISLVLAATKWDMFRGHAPEEQRVLGLALRCLAHANGAHLAYIGGLQPGGSGSERSRTPGSSDALQDTALDGFVRLVRHLVFTGLDKKLPQRLPPQVAPLSPLFVPAGADRLCDIGRPGTAWASAAGGASATAADLVSAVKEWCSAATTTFKAGSKPRDAASAAAASQILSDARWAEDNVDTARQRWDEALGAIAGIAAHESGRTSRIESKQAATSTPAPIGNTVPISRTAGVTQQPSSRDGSHGNGASSSPAAMTALLPTDAHQGQPRQASSASAALNRLRRAPVTAAAVAPGAVGGAGSDGSRGLAGPP